MIAIVSILSVNISSDYTGSDIGLDNLITKAFANNEDSEDTETLEKIKTYCYCYKDSNGDWDSMSITSCEEYEWSSPMDRTTCTETSCNSGSSCRD